MLSSSPTQLEFWSLPSLSTIRIKSFSFHLTLTHAVSTTPSAFSNTNITWKLTHTHKHIKMCNVVCSRREYRKIQQTGKSESLGPLGRLAKCISKGERCFVYTACHSFSLTHISLYECVHNCNNFDLQTFSPSGVGDDSWGERKEGNN
jgi:hypothetical protein